jgi:hypothetical protein
MSWSLSESGSKDNVREACTIAFDLSAKQYAGKEEEKDVLAVKERVLSAIDALDVAPDGYAEKGYSVKVNAYGSRGASATTLHAEVSRIKREE